MTTAHKSYAILLVAGLVAGSALFLTRRAPFQRASADIVDASGLEVKARLQSSHVLVGTGETYLAITITAPLAQDQRVRPPVNLAVVIDRSGSMAGEKLLHAKAAARQLVSQLTATDRVSIVTYGSDVTVAYPSTRATPEAQSALFRAIDSIYDSGGTNLSGGLEAGSDQIAQNPELGAVERVVLISDGLANEGIVNRDVLAQLAARTAEQGISITTVGVGLDFDEQTMTSIAVSGRGNYYFVESSLMLADMFAQELERLSATTATNVRLSISPMPSIEVLEVYGYPVEREGTHIIVPVADLHSGETRKVVARLRVHADKLGQLKVADVGVSFRLTQSLETRTARVATHTTVTDQEKVVLDHRDRETIRHVERARTAKVINEATVQYEMGNAEAARQMLYQQAQSVQSLARDLGDADFAAEIDSAAGSVQGDFAAAPDAPASDEGKRARKMNRKRAHDLMH